MNIHYSIWDISDDIVCFLNEMKIMEPEIYDNLIYKGWKLHIALVILSMVLGLIIAIIGMIVSGFDIFLFLLIPLMPFLLYSTTLFLGMVVVFGFGAVCLLLWHIGKWIYHEIIFFFEKSKTDIAYPWLEYFRIAGLMLIVWIFIMLVVFIIINGVYDILFIFRFFRS